MTTLAGRGPRRVVALRLAILAVLGLAAASADAAVEALPNAVTVAQGMAGPPILLRLSYPTLPISFGTLTGRIDVLDLPAEVTVSPSPLTYLYSGGSSFASTNFTIGVGPTAVPGTYALRFVDRTIGAGIATLILTVVPDVAASLSVQPSAVSVESGATSLPITVRLTFPRVLTGAGTGTISLAGLPPGVTSLPAAVAYPYAQGSTSAVASFQLLAAPTAPSGTHAIMLTDQTQHAGSAVLSLTVVHREPPPEVLGLTPPLVMAGAAPTTVRIIGRNLDPAGRVEGDTSGLQVLESRVLSATLAEITLAAPDNVTLGSRELRVVNSDGQRSASSVRLSVVASNPLLGSLSVTRLATLFPQPGTVLGPDNRVRARGVVVVTGVGTLTGSWLLDGVPFDRFVAPATGGYPVEITSSVPIPTLTAGEHRLELAIDTPQRMVSQGLALVGGDASRALLRLLSPADDAALKPEAAPEFRWMPAPGANGYEVELLCAKERRAFRAAEPSFTPDARTWRGMVGQTWQWRVRPVFLADTLGDASETRSLIILPARRAARRGALEHERTPGADASPSWSLAFAAGAAQPTVTGVAPGNGEIIADPQPIIDAQWSESGPVSSHALSMDGTDVTEMATWNPGRVLYRSIVPLVAGNHTVLLTLNGQAAGWTFTIGGAAEVPPTKRTDWGATALGTLAQWEQPQAGVGGVGAVPVATSNAALPPGSAARGQIALQTDLAYRAVTLRASGDLAARHDFDDPALAVPENRNWLVTADATQRRLRETATVGLGAPTFASQAQIVTTGLPRLGVEARVGGSRFSVSGYQSFDSGTAAVAGSGSFDQTLRAASAGFGSDADRASLRAVFLDVDSRAGPMTTGGKGQLYGLLGSFKLGNSVTVSGEAGHGTFEPSADSAPLATFWQQASLPAAFTSMAGPDLTSLPTFTTPSVDPSVPAPASSLLPKRSGNAWRLSAMGLVRGMSFAANYRESDAGFSNPANPGFTAGGVSGMRGADFTLNKPIIGGKGSLGLMLRHTDTPLSSAGASRVNDNGANLMLSLSAGSHLMATAASDLSFRSGNADESVGIPKTDSRLLGGSLTLVEVAGSVSISQMLAYQNQKDNVNPYGDMRTLCASISAAGALGSHVTLNLMGNGTRSVGAPELGTTEMWMVNAQPTLQFPKAWLALAPRASYTQMRNTVQGSKSVTEQYGGAVTLTPPWLRSLLGLVLQGDWARVRGAGLADETRFQRRVAAVITVRWSGGRGASFAPPTAGAAMPMMTGARTMAAIARDVSASPLW